MTASHDTPREALSGGAVLLVETDHALPLVSIVVALRTGSAFDPADKEGLARLAGRMLRRGCTGMSATDIEDAIERLGGELTIDLSASSLAFHVQVIGRNLDALVDLLARVLSTPTFDEGEYAKLQRETIADVVESRDHDRSLAQHFFRRAVFGAHPYARASLGTAAGLARVTVDDTRAFYRRHFTRGNAVIGFSGDVTRERARALGERLAAALHEGALVEDVAGEPVATPGRRLVLVDKPERTQTQIILGGLGTWPHDADHVALGVSNAVFGGTFTSRLMKAVRSERGWSYGAYARLAIDRRRQSFTVWTFPAATDVAPCIGLELELLEAWIDGGVTLEELAFIKQYLIRSQAFEIDTASKRLHQAVDVEVLSLPADYHSGYARHVEAVSLEDANAAVRRRVAKDDMVVTVVGTADEIRAAVEKAIPRLAETRVVPFDSED
jgi:zinc protease